jgi:hypothetical protein
MASDEQALVNDMLFEVESIYGGPPIKLVRGPIQFDHALSRRFTALVAPRTESSAAFWPPPAMVALLSCAAYVLLYKSHSNRL